MLTLKQPIKLNIASPMSVSFNMFSEKVRANYGLMASQIYPKELLLLVTASPELPEGLGGMTSIAMNRNEQNIRSTNLEVINNVVNRILMADRVDFTYQDSIYITTVLNKLGITDVSQFMNQVRSLSEENTNVYKLSQLYNNNLKLFKSFSNHMQQKEESTDDIKSKEAVTTTVQRYYMHNDIYKRLGTAQIYSTVHSAKNSQIQSTNSLFRSELRTAEQLRVSRELSLMEAKWQTFSNTRIMMNHVNHYETGDISQSPQTEKQVLSQGAAAALVSLVDNVMISRINQINSKQDFWIDLKTAISQSAQNSLTRFQIYHTQPIIAEYAGDEYAQQISHLYKEEANTISNFFNELTQLKTDSYLSRFNEQSLMQTINLGYLSVEGKQEELPDEIDKNPKQELQNFDQKLLTQITQQLLLGNKSDVKNLDVLSQPTIKVEQEHLAKPSNEQLIYQLESRYFDTVLQLSNEETRLIQKIEQIDENSREIYNETLLQKYLNKNESVQLVNQTSSMSKIENVMLVTDKNEATQFINQIFSSANQENNVTFADSRNPIINLDQKQTEQYPQPLIYEQENFSTETVHEMTSKQDDIVNQLDEINEKNREIHQELLANHEVSKKTTITTSPDRKKIIQDALRSIDNPKQVMKEILEAPTVVPPNYSNESDPAIDIILAHADENTRNIYETIRQYEENPSQAISSGKIRAVSMGEFNAVVREVEKHQTIETEHLIQSDTIESEIVRHQIETVMERLNEIPAQEGSTNNDIGYGKLSVPIVHRQQENQISEELLELFEQQNKKENHQMVTNQVVTRETVNHTEVNNMNQQTLAREKQEITEIVNRTLDRQMGTITERVYSQMERKLQSERSRRGW